jgi:hypothetical protein
MPSTPQSKDIHWQTELKRRTWQFVYKKPTLLYTEKKMLPYGKRVEKVYQSNEPQK